MTLEEAYISIYEDNRLSGLKGFVDNQKFTVSKEIDDVQNDKSWRGVAVAKTEQGELCKIFGDPDSIVSSTMDGEADLTVGWKIIYKDVPPIIISSGVYTTEASIDRWIQGIKETTTDWAVWIYLPDKDANGNAETALAADKLSSLGIEVIIDN